MGTIEKVAKTRRRWGQFQHAVLATIAVAGVLAVAATAPNTLQLLGGFTRKRYQFNYQVKSALTRMTRSGLIRFVHKNGYAYAEVTEKGQQALQTERLRAEMRLRTKKRWDRRWRLVVFDIPEKHKNYRNQLRHTLREIGFLKVQNSVWVFPYECEDLMQLIKTDLHVGKHVLYAVVENMENDSKLRMHFKLPQ